MKVSKHILFRLLFLTAVIFCLGLEVYTNYNTQICNTELSSGQECGENDVFSGIDSFNDDHINQINEPLCSVEQKVLIPFSNDSFLIKKFPISTWQPPKSA